MKNSNIRSLVILKKEVEKTLINITKPDKQDQKLLALWAADCAEHVLPYFEREYPKDDRPRKAIKACREWVSTGVFKMADVRKVALAAHAAARTAKEDSPARFAARALATAHVARHALGAAIYALKVADAAGITGEREWQSKRLPKSLRLSPK
jgi:hypothetical protein